MVLPVDLNAGCLIPDHWQSALDRLYGLLPDEAQEHVVIDSDVMTVLQFRVPEMVARTINGRRTRVHRHPGSITTSEVMSCHRATFDGLDKESKIWLAAMLRLSKMPTRGNWAQKIRPPAALRRCA